MSILLKIKGSSLSQMYENEIINQQTTQKDLERE